MTNTHAPAGQIHGQSEPRWSAIDMRFVRARHGRVLADAVPDAMHDDGALASFFAGPGRDLGLAPNALFDEDRYIAANADVEGGVHDGIFATGFQHYRESGFRSRAPHWLFSEQEYFSRNPDLSPHQLDETGFCNGYDHFLCIGDREGRTGHAFFDPMLFRDEALAAATGLDLDRSMFEQFLAGRQGVRTSWYFDPAWYLQAYPVVVDAIARGAFSGPLHHYLTNDTPQAFDPNALFSEAFYAARYPDVNAIVQAGGFRNGYEHFLRFGVHEGREPAEDAVFAAYRDHPGVRRDIALGRFEDSFAHYAQSRARGRDVVSTPPPASAAMQRTLAWRRAESLLPLLARAPLDFRSFERPAVSVVISARNGFLWTIAALTALRECTRRAVEPILIDAGSTDATRTIERLVDGLVVIRPARRLSLAARLEAGMAVARAPVLAFLDPADQFRLGAIDAALARFDDDAVGAVTGRVTDLDLVVIEAGLTVYRDGNIERPGVSGPVDAPSIGFSRDCDAGGGPLFVRCSAITPDDIIDPDALHMGDAMIDLSLALRQAGKRVVYDPAVLARRIGAEPAPASIREAARLRRRDRFRVFLRHQPAGAHFMNARIGTDVPRVLVLCGQVPLAERRGLEAALATRIRLLHAAGCAVAVYALDGAPPDAVALARNYGAEIEVLGGQGEAGLLALLEGRRHGFDRIWICGVDCLERSLFAFHQAAHALPTRGFILDIAALRSVEQRGRRRVGGFHDHDALMADLRVELRDAWFCQTIVVATDDDAALVRRAGFDNVSPLTHGMADIGHDGAVPDYAARDGILCVPAMRSAGDAAHDGLDWFVHACAPLLERRLPEGAMIGIGGSRPASVDLSPLARYRRVRLLDPHEPLARQFGAWRVLVVPDRFSAGVAPEILAAAAAGLPAVLSDDVADRLAWKDGPACLNGGIGDVARICDSITALYTDEALWTRTRDAARADALGRYGSAAATAAILDILRAADPVRTHV